MLKFRILPPGFLTKRSWVNSTLPWLAAVSTSLSAAPRPDLQDALTEWRGPQPGGIAAAYVDETGVTFFNAGHFSDQNTALITAETQFEIGSLSKVFTALLLADSILVDKVAVDQPVGPPFARSQITYRQLATHTSGLPSLPPKLLPADLANPYADQDLPALVEAFDSLSASARKGPSAYSNLGFAVLGQAVAGAWGESYEELLTRRVLQPMGLNDTKVGWRNADMKRLAPGHGLGGPAKNWDLNAYEPAGALVSTSADLSRFIQACLGFVDTPLAQAVAETSRGIEAGEMKGSAIGLAWIVEIQGSSEIVWHNGGTGGYRSFMGYNRTRKFGVILLANRTEELDSLGLALLSDRLPTPEKKQEAAETLKEFLGDYPLSPSFVMTVTANGEQLFVQATHQPRLELIPLAPDRYQVKEVEAEITFERDREHQVEALTLHQNGAHQRAQRQARGQESTTHK